MDDGRPRRIVHRHDQRVADARDRHDERAPREAWVDERVEGSVQPDRVQVEEVDVQLQAERLPHLLLGDVLQPDDDLAE